jgi:transcriptional regulator with XRE-family HTH domain
MPNPTLEQVLGGNLRRLRLERGWRQDDLAEKMRRIGARPVWSQATVASTERGSRRASLGEVLLLAGIFNTPLDRLLATDADWMEVAGAVVPGKGPYRLGGEDPLLGLSERLASAAEVASDAQFRPVRAVARRYGVGEDRETLYAILATSHGEAERKAARRLGTEPLEVAGASFSLWGHGLTKERDSRLTGEGDARALRGHITRTLLQEIEGRIPRRRRGRKED